MAQDSEETLRLIIMLGQAFVPPVRELMAVTARLAGRAAARAGSLAAAAARQAAGRAVSAVADASVGHGSVGIVGAGGLGGQTGLVDVTEFFSDREDIARLNETCRGLGIGVRIHRNPADGRLAVEFATRDAAKFDWAMGALFARTVDADRLRSELAGPDGELPDGWTMNADGSASRDVSTLSDKIYRATAHPDGTWEMRGPDGNVAKMEGVPLEGAQQESPEPPAGAPEPDGVAPGDPAPAAPAETARAADQVPYDDADAAFYAEEELPPIDLPTGPAVPTAGTARAARAADTAAASVADPAVRAHAAREMARERAAARPDSTEVSARELMDGVNGRGRLAPARNRPALAAGKAPAGRKPAQAAPRARAPKVG